MDVKFQEYVRGVSVKLSVQDAPMTALRALVDAFVTACSEVEAKAEAAVSWVPIAAAIDEKAVEDAHNLTTRILSDFDAAMSGGYQVIGKTIMPGEPGYEEVAAMQEAEAPKKRGRPRKVAEAAESAGIVKIDPAEYESGLYRTPDGVVIRVGPEATEDSETGNTDTTSKDTPSAGPAEAPQSEPTNSDDSVASISTSDEDPVTDTELQRFSARIAQHYGNPQKVFDLAGKFVPDGAVPRPTNIRDTAARWAFIRAAETESGLKFHG